MLAGYSKQIPDGHLEAVPEAQAIQKRVEDVGQDTVAGVLRIRVMPGMVVGRLHQPQPLEPGDDLAVFLLRPVRPLVDFVGVEAEYHEEPHVPCQQSEGPRHRQHDEPRRDEQARTAGQLCREK